MTPKMRKMLASIADGADVNLIAQLARVMGKREEHVTARTVLALLKRKMLQHSKTGGLEISDLGRATAKKHEVQCQKSK